MTLTELKNLIPEYIIQIGEELQKNNFECYLVGGSIRDILMGRKPDDFDLATNAYPEDLIKIFKKSIPTGAKFGTITVIVEDKSGENFEVQVTTYRSEEDYVGGRWPSKVEFAKTINDDLSRRDFTINSIALNVEKLDEISGEDIEDILIDPFNGLNDLKENVIRAVRDPFERLSEDGLRAVRACRLASQLGFRIEDSTMKAIKQTNHVTAQVSIERFRDELIKMLIKSPKPSIGLDLLRESGILKIFIPELLEGIEIVQPEFHSDDVFTHSIKTVDKAEDDIKLAALFHDIGKPRTRSEDEKGIHFYGHDIVGSEMTREIMKRLRFSNNEIERVVKLVRWHMFYYPSADWRKENVIENDLQKDDFGWTDGAIRRLIKNVGGESNIDDLMKLRIADADSNPKNNFNPIELDALALRIADVRAKDMALTVKDLDINGNDLMENFKIEPSKEMKDILNYLLEKVIDDQSLNKKIDLLRLTKEYLDKKKD